MKTNAERVVQALRNHGPCTCEDLSGITHLPADEISSMLREFRRNSKYGLVQVGQVGGRRGTPRKIVAIDEALYATYLATRYRREAAARPPAPVRKFPRPITEFTTRWQPASPYYQAAP
jgi:hypothetical protein